MAHIYVHIYIVPARICTPLIVSRLLRSLTNNRITTSVQEVRQFLVFRKSRTQQIQQCLALRARHPVPIRLIQNESISNTYQLVHRQYRRRHTGTHIHRVLQTQSVFLLKNVSLFRDQAVTVVPVKTPILRNVKQQWKTTRLSGGNI